MGIILFLVDTSASMNQRTILGTSYLDVAKGAIDTFMKVRTRACTAGASGCTIVPWVRVRAVFLPPCRRGAWISYIAYMATLCLSL